MQSEIFKNIYFYLGILASLVPKFFIVQSGSMEPAIKTGSLVAVSKSTEYKNGDIISFRSSSDSKKIITHRINFIDKDGYITAGDANENLDNGKVTDSQILGKVSFSVPYVGYIGNFAKTPWGFIFLIIIPATIIVYEELKFLKVEFLKLISKFKKQSDSSENLSLSKASVLIPLIASFFVLTAFSVSYFLDTESSKDNILGASTSYGEKTAPLYNSDPYSCSVGATNLASPQAKLVILKKEAGKIKVTVKLEGATPNSSYDIWINQDPGGCPLASPTLVAGIITDISGNGTGSAEVDFVVGATNFWISAVGGGQVLRSTAVTL